jgi:hypothetical protein
MGHVVKQRREEIKILVGKSELKESSQIFVCRLVDV